LLPELVYLLIGQFDQCGRRIGDGLGSSGCAGRFIGARFAILYLNVPARFPDYRNSAEQAGRAACYQQFQ
jgi:hypothetical protein